MKNIFDTHCHPNLNKIKNQEEIINNFFNKGGKYLNVIGTNPETNKEVLEITNKYKGVYCSVGIHPCDVNNLDFEKTFIGLENQIKSNKNTIVGIGECGLDYYWLKPENDDEINSLDTNKQKILINSRKQKQKLFFKAQIKLANKFSLPIIIHNRESKDDILDILKETKFKNFIFHCFSENLEYANKLIEFSPECKISFSGIVTFKNAKEIQETAKNIDIKYVLAETDSPYLTPTPFRGKEENEPIFTKHVIEKINELRGKDCTKEIFNNSKKVFGLI